jgi:hypothetical protein
VIELIALAVIGVALWLSFSNGRRSERNKNSKEALGHAIDYNAHRSDVMADSRSDRAQWLRDNATR